MLFFDLDFLLLFLAPLFALLTFGSRLLNNYLAIWLGSLASAIFLLSNNQISLFVALSSVVVNFAGAKLLLRQRRQSLFIFLIALNLATLIYFKYTLFIEHQLFTEQWVWTWRAALPLGISFYTFQQIAFLTDIYRNRIDAITFKIYSLFILFFPQFIAGPIVHLSRVRRCYERWPRFNARSLRFGLTLFAIGMAKKWVGDEFGVIADECFAAPESTDFFFAWVGLLSFAFQIYFDFSGYCDMAVGIARLFGVGLPYNFNSPYKATSLSDFWRRWHITLSEWLRDHLYIPLGGNRHGATRTAIALVITMVLGGFWHGAAWTFVLWGLFHGIALWVARNIRMSSPIVVRRLVIFLFVTLAWVLFRAESLNDAVIHYQALIGANGFDLTALAWPQTAGIAGAMIVCFALPNSQHIALWCAARKVNQYRHVELPLLAFTIFVFALALVTPDISNAFIYFEF